MLFLILWSGSLVEKVSLLLINVLVGAKIHTRLITKGHMNYSPYCFHCSCLCFKMNGLNTMYLLMFSNKLIVYWTIFRTSERSLKSLNFETCDCFPVFKDFKVSKHFKCGLWRIFWLVVTIKRTQPFTKQDSEWLNENKSCLWTNWINLFVNELNEGYVGHVVRSRSSMWVNFQLSKWFIDITHNT